MSEDQLRSRIKDRAGETIAGYGDYSRILSDLQGLMEMESICPFIPASIAAFLSSSNAFAVMAMIGNIF